MYGIEERWLTTRGAVDKIREAISSKSPFSLVRVQDGEYRFIEHESVSLRDLEQIIWVHFGRQAFPDRYVKFISEGVVSAARNADIVGLFRGPLVVGPQDGEYRRILYSAVRRNMIGLNAHVVNADIHNSLLVEDSFKDFLQGLPFLGLVTCRHVAGAVSQRFQIPDVRTYLIPEQSQFATNRTDLYANRPHFPDVFFDLSQQIQVPFAGAVFLVGAGMLGKVYCDIIKQRGGIAIDVGSVFDAWDGVMSRAQFSGSSIFNEIEPKYRLHDRRDSMPGATFVTRAQWLRCGDDGTVSLQEGETGGALQTVSADQAVHIGSGPVGGAPVQAFEGREDLRQKLAAMPGGATVLRSGYTRNIEFSGDQRVNTSDDRAWIDNELIGADLNANVSASASGKVFASADYADALQDFARSQVTHPPVRFELREEARDFWAFVDFEVLRPVKGNEFATAVAFAFDDESTTIAIRAGLDHASQAVIIYGGEHAVAGVRYDFGVSRRFKVLMSFGPKTLAIANNGHLFQPMAVAAKRGSILSATLGSYITGSHALGGRIHAFGFGNGVVSRADMIGLTS